MSILLFTSIASGTPIKHTRTKLSRSMGKIGSHNMHKIQSLESISTHYLMRSCGWKKYQRPGRAQVSYKSWRRMMTYFIVISSKIIDFNKRQNNNNKVLNCTFYPPPEVTLKHYEVHFLSYSLIVFLCVRTLTSNEIEKHPLAHSVKATCFSDSALPFDPSTVLCLW